MILGSVKVFQLCSKHRLHGQQRTATLPALHSVILGRCRSKERKTSSSRPETRQCQGFKAKALFGALQERLIFWDHPLGWTLVVLPWRPLSLLGRNLSCLPEAWVLFDEQLKMKTQTLFLLFFFYPLDLRAVINSESSCTLDSVYQHHLKYFNQRMCPINRGETNQSCLAWQQLCFTTFSLTNGLLIEFENLRRFCIKCQACRY